MKIHEIENLSAEVIKANQAELIESAKKVDSGDLAERYVQARLDSKRRDEKLAEQGVTIKLLQDGTTLSLENTVHLTAKLAEMESSKAAVVTDLAGVKSLASQLKTEVSVALIKYQRAKQLAKARRGALADVLKIVSPLLAEEG